MGSISASCILQEDGLHHFLFNALAIHINFQELAHQFQLVVFGPDLDPFLLYLAGLSVFRRHQLDAGLQDVGQPLGGLHLTPQVVGLDSLRVGWIAGALLPALVERQEPQCSTSEMGADMRLVVVNGDVGHALPQLEEDWGVALWGEEGASELKRETQLKGVIHGSRAGGVLLPLPLQGDRPRFIHLSRPGVGRQRPPQAGAAAIRGQCQAQ